MSITQIPEQMTAVVLDSYAGAQALRLEQRPVPQPGKNEVLIKVAASPINPSDLAFLEGLYQSPKSIPVVPGFEGSGTVVAAGPGIMGRYLLGKRVACFSLDQRDGVWADYLVTPATAALPLGKGVSLEQGAMSAVNPLTALAFLSIMKEGRHQAIVQTAAASALGHMVNRLAQHERIQVINVVRRQAQVELLKQQGATIIINSSDPDFSQQLRDACHQHQALLAFDAVAGSLTLQLLEAMPRHSKVTIYGGLSFEAAQAHPGQLIFEDKSIDGFWLTHWIGQKNPLQSLMLWQRNQKLLTSLLRSEVRAHHPLEDVIQAVQTYQNQMTGGKILLVPEAA